MEMKLDATAIAAALLHDAVEDTQATSEEIAERLRRPGGAHRRRRDQDRQDSVRQPRGPAGGKRAQDAAGHGVGRARGAHQAGRPAAQHAHAGAPEARAAGGDRARDPGHLRPAGAPAGHGQGARRARGPGLPLHRSGELRAGVGGRGGAPRGGRAVPARRGRHADGAVARKRHPGARGVAHQAPLLHLIRRSSAPKSPSTRSTTCWPFASSRRMWPRATRSSASSTPCGGRCRGASRISSPCRAPTATSRCTPR